MKVMDERETQKQKQKNKDRKEQGGTEGVIKA